MSQYVLCVPRIDINVSFFSLSFFSFISEQKSCQRAATVAMFCICGEMPSVPQQAAVRPFLAEPVQLSCVLVKSEWRQLQLWRPVRHVPDGVVSWTDCCLTD